MAKYATDKDLIRAVQAAASSLSVASKWSTGARLKVADSFLLEMFLLFQIIQDLQTSYDVQYVPGTGTKKHCFPKSPSSKAGRPKFLVKDKSTRATLFQICAGTTVDDLNGHSRALDVSIQASGASDTPIHTDVLQIFDAKYRKTISKRLSHHEFSEFARWIELFGLRTGGTAGLTFSSLSEFDANCLVTNGQPSTELDVECNRTGLREITNFHPKTTYVSRP